MKNTFPIPKSGLPLLILEAGVNHDGNLNRAIELIDLAAQTDADFIKFQTYTANKLAALESPAYWNLEEESTRSQLELFKKYDGFTLDDYLKLVDRATKSGIGFLTTCFDTEWLEALNPFLPFLKIASADLTNRILIEAAAKTHKPLLISTGAASMQEIRNCLDWIKELSDAEICLMHCVLNYPTEFGNANLSRLTTLAKTFPQVLLGYSDHTRSEFSFQSIALAQALGVQVIEKHFTWNKRATGNDHYHSFNQDDVKKLYLEMNQVRQMLEYDESNFLKTQDAARKFARRGLYAARALSSGDIIGITDLLPLRPTVLEHGFDGSESHDILGRKVSKTILEGEAITKKNLM